ncbi:sugar transferase [Thioclava nitratireducens]|uniref:sugar transferase n=1 Tax=Thioclava nitratireducens TaxID=1915078 RepID=UPI0024808482|nr:sugar transferase [Thioclava nitratireducens]WGT48815.1 sugar transferase [Thioclava nitratireducens]
MTQVRRRRKRLFDLTLAMLALPMVVPLIALVWLIIAMVQGRPWFHGGERMHSPTRSFRMWKFRTMAADPGDYGVSGGHKAGRITPLGRLLRRCHADELPQIWNVLRGDMSFVGPRPPLREVVERFPALYAQVLTSPPGITGLASVQFAAKEARLMASCRSAEEARRIYDRVCVPQKARLDLLYQRRASCWLDLALIWQTLRGARA